MRGLVGFALAAVVAVGCKSKNDRRPPALDQEPAPAPREAPVDDLFAVARPVMTREPVPGATSEV